MGATTSVTLEKPEKPKSEFVVKINGEETTIKMSFALFQEIMKVIPSPESVGDLLLQDFHLREYVVRRVLTGNKRVKNDEELIDLFETEVEDEKLDDLILWVTDHVLYFFMTTVEKTGVLGEKYKDAMRKTIQSVQSQTGSQN